MVISWDFMGFHGDLMADFLGFFSGLRFFSMGKNWGVAHLCWPLAVTIQLKREIPTAESLWPWLDFDFEPGDTTRVTLDWLWISYD